MKKQDIKFVPPDMKNMIETLTIHLQPVYKDAPAYTNGVSERLFSCGLCLPSGPYVREEEIKYIVRIIVENL